MSKPALAVVGHIGPEPRGERLSLPHALAALAALAQPTGSRPSGCLSSGSRTA